MDSRLFANNFSYGGGISVTYKILPFLSITAEADILKNHVAMGASSSSLVKYGVTTGGSYTEKYTYSSLDIPVLVTYYLGMLGIYAGPYLSFPETYFTGLEQEGTYTYGDTTKEYSMFPATTNLLIPGIACGVSYAFDISSKFKVQTDVRYIYDFVAINDTFHRSGLYLGISLFVIK